MSEEDLEEYKRITLDNFVKADKRIRNNDFRIAPFYAGENKNACQYCQYRDICFVKKEQRRLPSDYQESEEENE